MRAPLGIERLARETGSHDRRSTAPAPIATLLFCPSYLLHRYRHERTGPRPLETKPTLMNIEITPKKSDGLERLIEVRVPIETVRDAEEKAARRYATGVRLPGFRPGKAPPAMVKKRFKDAIRQQVIESLVQEAFQEVMDREQLKVASQPHVHDLKFEEGEPLSFELHVEVRPEIALARTQGFRVTRNQPAVSEDQVRDQLEQVREQKASWTPI